MTDPREERAAAAARHLQPRMTEWVRDLVRIPSVTGDEAAAQAYVQSLLMELDLEVESFCPQREEIEDHPSFSDDGLPIGSRPVVLGRRRGRTKGARSIILNGHIDVVPTGDAARWPHPPWQATLRDGAIWGRGACDMKGGLVAGITALAALREAGLELDGDVLVQSVIGEESGGIGTLACVARGQRADAAVILEPTRLDVCPVGAGAASFRLRVRGQAAHGALREDGVSAIEKFAAVHAVLQDLERSRNTGYSSPLFPRGRLVAPLSVGKVAAGDWPSTVPDDLVAEGRYGVLPGESLADARALFERAVASAAVEDGWLRQHPPEVLWFEGQFAPAACPEGAAIVQEMVRALRDTGGASPSVRGVPYGSDLRFFTGDAGMPAVLCGPGDVRYAHSVDEHVAVADLTAAASAAAVLLLRWGRADR